MTNMSLIWDIPTAAEWFAKNRGKPLIDTDGDVWVRHHKSFVLHSGKTSIEVDDLSEFPQTKFYAPFSVVKAQVKLAAQEAKGKLFGGSDETFDAIIDPITKLFEV